MGPRGESTTVRFIVDPSELEELGLSPSRVFGPSGQAPAMPGPADVAGGGGTRGGGGGPGGGAMTGAMIGVLVGGVIGMVQFLGQLLQNSKVLNTYAQSFGKVFSAAMDLLLMPFIPVLNLMLAGLLKLVGWLITSGYIEKMSRFVTTTLVPLLEGLGAGLQHIWSAMNQTLDPRKWDWGRLGSIAAGMLEYTAAMFLADLMLDISLIPGLGGVAGAAHGLPEQMVNQARGIMGQAPVNDVGFAQLQGQFNAAVGLGAGMGAAMGLSPLGPVGLVGGTAGGMAAGASGAALSGMSQDAETLNQPLSDMWGPGTKAYLKQRKSQNNVTANITITPADNTAQVQRTADEQAKQQASLTAFQHRFP